MAVTNTTRLDSCREHIFVAEHAELPRFDLVCLLSAEVVADRAPGLCEVLLHVAANRRDGSVLGYRRVASRRFVKTGDVGGELVDVRRFEEAGFE